MIKVKWVALDWGTTNLRAYAVDENNAVVDQLSCEKGLAVLKPEDFEPLLLDVVSPWLSISSPLYIFACGMVGAKQGWVDAGYRQVPCEPVYSEQLIRVNTNNPKIVVHIVPGLCQRAPDNVLRGEETQIAGFLSHKAGYQGAICLPGTHSKWVEVRQGKVIRFNTAMTGELFSVFSKHSILQHTVQSSQWNENAFLAALDSATQSSGNIANQLFGLRSRSILSDIPNGDLKSSLSGMLIGSELLANLSLWDGKEVALIGSGNLLKLYQKALSQFGCEPIIYEDNLAIINGLTQFAEHFLKVRHNA